MIVLMQTVLLYGVWIIGAKIDVGALMPRGVPLIVERIWQSGVWNREGEHVEELKVGGQSDGVYESGGD